MACSSLILRLVATAFVFLTSCVSAFNGTLEIRDLVIEAPFEADPQGTTNTTLSFAYSNQNLPKEPPIRCHLTWAVGLPAPVRPQLGDCQDPYVRARFPIGTYKGVANFQLEIEQSYEDSNVGEYPYNSLSLTGEWNITYDGTGNGEVPTTKGYTCDVGQGKCHSEPGAVFKASILRAWS